MGMTFEALTGRLGINTASWTRGFKQATVSAQQFRQRVTAAFSKVRAGAAKTVQALGAVSGAAVAMGAAVAGASAKTAANFEQSMARVQAITGATTEEFKKLEEQAKMLGATTQFTASQAAEAMGFFALAGFKSNEIMGVMPDVLNLAAAGQLDMATAADITSKTIRGMGLDVSDAGRVMDLLTKTFTTSNTDLIQLGDAFKFVGPVAAASGRGMEEVAASIALLSDAGIQGGMAGTTLRQMLITLSKPSAEGAKLMSKLGIEVADATGKMLPLGEVIRQLSLATDGLTEEAKLNVIGRIFPARTLGGVLALMEQGADRMVAKTNELADSAGTAARIAQIQMDTTSGAFKILLSALEGVQIAIGDKVNPRLREMAEFTAEWLSQNSAVIAQSFDKVMNLFAKSAERFNGALDNTIRRLKPFRNLITDSTDGLKKLLAEGKRIFNLMPDWAQDLVTVGAGLTTVVFGVTRLITLIPFLGAAMQGLIAGVPVVGWVLAFAAAVGLLIANWDKVSTWVKGKFPGLVDAVSKGLDIGRKSFADFGVQVNEFWQALVKRIWPSLISLWESLQSLIVNLGAKLADLFKTIVEAFGDISWEDWIGGAIDSIVRLTDLLVKLIDIGLSPLVLVLKTAVNLVGGLVAIVDRLLHLDFKGAAEAMGKMITSIADDARVALGGGDKVGAHKRLAFADVEKSDRDVRAAEFRFQRDVKARAEKASQEEIERQLLALEEKATNELREVRKNQLRQELLAMQKAELREIEHKERSKLTASEAADAKAAEFAIFEFRSQNEIDFFEKKERLRKLQATREKRAADKAAKEEDKRLEKRARTIARLRKEGNAQALRNNFGIILDPVEAAAARGAAGRGSANRRFGGSLGGGLFVAAINGARNFGGNLTNAARGIGAGAAAAGARIAQKSPLEQIAIRIALLRGQISALGINLRRGAGRLLRGGFITTNADRVRNQMLEQLRKLVGIQEEEQRRRRRQRLRQFRTFQRSRRQAAVRRREERDVFGTPGGTVNTGPTLVASGASTRSLGRLSLSGNGAKILQDNGTVNVQMTFTEKITPSSARRIATALDDHLRRAGVDSFGRSKLRR